MQWLHEHEMRDLANIVGYDDCFAYSGLLFCRYVVQNDLTSTLVKQASVYTDRVSLRQNPPIDKVREILLEAFQFKGEAVETFAMDVDMKVYAAMNDGMSCSQRNRRRFFEKSEGKKLDKLFELMTPAQIMKGLSSAHWHKAFLQAIDFVCGKEEMPLLFGVKSNGVSVDRDLLTQQRHDAQVTAASFARQRQAAIHEMELEEMKRDAADQKRLAEKYAAEAAERKLEQVSEKKIAPVQQAVESPAKRYSNTDPYQYDLYYQQQRERRENGYAREPVNETERAEEHAFTWGNGARPSFY
jgi:hypothetical protein